MESVIDEIFGRYKQGRKEDLIPILQEIQEKAGHISEYSIVRLGSLLGISTTKIYGLATFYDQFRFFPAGKVHLRVCHGTSCFMNGSGPVLASLKEELGIEPGQTTRDGRFSYEVVTCMGSCSIGPVIEVNGEYHTGVKSDQIPAMIKRLKHLIDN
ncbi:MAG: NAD(P)H-dependent oxidoreductase subunit E [Bacteroidetes bacterium]|nr:NAD(P)H-dependent oxidoreductase subunit E [Bacteroidota bacterium]